ncbi:DUF4249 family protein [Reichenbachiella agariperforans]|uniref:DUF4249 family protein n=1 Tax=Reichenbachiella agariperforans TaxID=156994 RepID=UPI001C081328|nr:DUF4249 family protein [Reichenbachiella agariperforans]MBU2914147.1 DUF4249 domain-containing protein [Reichenbachiella agariperforans]
MSFHSRFTLLALISVLTCCTPELVPFEDLELSNSNTTIELVISGSVTSFNQNQIIVINTPWNFISATGNESVSGAIVEVFDGDTMYSYSESSIEGEEGIYLSDNSFAGEIGHTYRVHVKYNGRDYYAEDTMISLNEANLPLPIIGVEFERGSYGLELYRHNFGYEQPLRLKTINTTSELSNQQSNLFFFSNNDRYFHDHLPVEGLHNREVNIIPIWGKEEDEISLYYFSISPLYYKYLLSVFQQTDWSVGPLISQPGNIKTNWNFGATGFFYATFITEKEILIKDCI